MLAFWYLFCLTLDASKCWNVGKKGAVRWSHIEQISAAELMLSHHPKHRRGENRKKLKKNKPENQPHTYKYIYIKKAEITTIKGIKNPANRDLCEAAASLTGGQEEHPESSNMFPFKGISLRGCSNVCTEREQWWAEERKGCSDSRFFQKWRSN